MRKEIDLFYFVAEYTSAQQSYDYPLKTGVVLFGTTDKKTLYRNGELRESVKAEFFQDLKILKEYGVSWDNSGEMYNRFIQDYPPNEIDWETEADKRPLGLIDPNGKFYITCYGGHSDLAFRLATAFYGVDYYRDDEEFLLSKNWISARGTFYHVDFKSFKFTAQQLDTLNRLLELNNYDEKYCKEILYFIKDWSEDDN